MHFIIQAIAVSAEPHGTKADLPKLTQQNMCLLAHPHKTGWIHICNP